MSPIRGRPNTLATVAAAMIAIMAVGAVHGQDAFDWRQYDGHTLRVVFSQHPMSDQMIARIDAFEQTTGIQVQVETFAEEQHRLRRYTEFLGGSSTIDVYNCQISQEGEQYASAGWAAPLQPFLDDPRLTAPDYGFSDFGAGAVDKGRTMDGTLYGMPFAMTSTVFFYRADLFEEYGIAVPESWDDVEAAAAQIHEATNGEVYGIVLRGTGTSVFAPILFSYGGAWEQDGLPTLDSAESIAAAELYGRLLRSYGPAGAVNHGWYETTTLFSEGRAAMKLDSSAFIPLFEDAETSRVAGQVGYTPTPAGPTGVRQPRIGGWEICISGQSTQPEAAWLFVQFMTNEEAAVEYLVDAQLDIGRSSAWTHPSVVAELGTPEWADVLAFNAAHGIDTKTAPPSIVTTREAEASISQMIQASILGRDVAAAARDTQRELEAILAREQAD